MSRPAMFLCVPLIVALFTSPASFTRGGGLHKSRGDYGLSTTSSQGQFSTNRCDAGLSIDDVRYAGKKSGHDLVKVSWNFASLSPCIPSRGDPFQHPFIGQAKITVKVKRLILGDLGEHGSASESLLSTGAHVTEVQIPRRLIEQDPAEFDANIEISGSLGLIGADRVSGNGVPSLSSKTAISSLEQGPPAQCFPKVAITGISYLQGSGSQKDTVTVSWTVAKPQSKCLTLTNDIATVRLKRANSASFDGGSSLESSSGGNKSATIQIPGGPGNVVSFDVSVSAVANAVISLTQNRSGSF